MSASALLFSPEISLQPGFEFPESLTEKYRPRSIAEFAGLEKPKRIMSNLLATPKISNWLFIGPSGTGKTTMALAFAECLPAELHHIPSQNCNLANVERVRRTCQYVPRQGCKMHVVLIDEADQMTEPAQISLLSMLDATNPAPNTIWIATCNSTERLERRFLSRFHEVEFKSYGMSSDATTLLQRVWNAEAPGTTPPNLARIVKDSNNNVREALMRLETEIMAS